ncbi:MFS transporter [Saccharopolyspora indica]|uniref:MFS transporter n=1 Tax=Saccharopolyspora indica TaxID=1229659 RepID=UPI0022EA42EF|nr:MFS transporter [Saccharopolyspora indica]MDA3649573.1 MFS transporter [Saccharopolyspora indica]
MATTAPQVVGNSTGPTSTSSVQHAPLGRSLVVFVLTALLATGQMYAVIPLMGEMASEWNVDTASMTWLVSAFGFGYAGGFVLFGPLADRCGHRRIVVAGVLAAALATALVATVPGIAAAIAARVLQGLMIAAFPPCVLAYIAERSAPQHRTVKTTAVTTAFLASAVVAQIAAQLIADALGWRMVFTAGALAFAVMALALRTAMLPDRPAPNSSPLDAYRAVPALLRSPRLRLLYAATPAVFGSFVAVYTGLQLTGIAGSPQALLTLRASALPVMLAIPFLTPWLRRITSAFRIALALLLAAVVNLLTALLAPGTAWLSILLMAFVAGIAIAAPAMIETVGARADRARSTAISLSTFWFFVGAGLGPLLAGALTGYGFSTLLHVLAAALAGGAVLVLITARRHA